MTTIVLNTLEFLFSAVPLWFQLGVGVAIVIYFLRNPFPERDSGQPAKLQPHKAWSDPTWSYEVQQAKRVEKSQILEKIIKSESKEEEEKSDKDIIKLDVILIGGGAAGLALGGELEKKNISNYLIIEKNKKSGDIWRSRYHRLHLHDLLSNEHLPHFPMPDTYPECPSREEFATYLDAYKEVLGIKVRFESEVVQALYLDEKRPQELDSAYRWKVKVFDFSTQQIIFYYTKHLVISHGLYGAPLIPSFPHSSDFKGLVYHSSQYTNATDLKLKDKKVLVVGFGNSGAELCLDLLEHGAAKVDCYTRSPITLVPRDTLQTLGNFVIEIRKFWRLPFAWLLGLPIFLLYEILFKLILRVKWGLVEKYGVKLMWKGPLTRMVVDMQPPLIDVGTMDCIVKGQIGCLASPIADLSENGVILQNGEKKEYDAIIWATGFSVLTGHNSILEKRISDRIGEGGKGFKVKTNKAKPGTQCPTVPGLWWQWGNLILIRIGAARISTAIRHELNPKIAQEDKLKLKLKILRFLVEHVVVLYAVYLFNIWRTRTPEGCVVNELIR